MKFFKFLSQRLPLIFEIFDSFAILTQLLSFVKPFFRVFQKFLPRCPFSSGSFFRFHLRQNVLHYTTVFDFCQALFSSFAKVFFVAPAAASAGTPLRADSFVRIPDPSPFVNPFLSPFLSFFLNALPDGKNPAGNASAGFYHIWCKGHAENQL